MSELPKAPPGLTASARRLWDAVAAPYVLTTAELAMLEEACHTRTELDRLEKAVRALPDLVTGSMGQPRTHPLLAEVRAHRTLLAKLTEQLNLPDEGSAGRPTRRPETRQKGRSGQMEQE